MNHSNHIILGNVITFANTGLDAIKRAPIVDFDTGVKCLRIQDVSQSKDFNNWGFSNVGEKNYKNFNLKKFDIIVARTGDTVGVNKIIKKDLKSVYNNGLIRLKINTEKANPYFIYFSLQTKKFKNYISSVARSVSTQPNLRVESLLNFELFNLPLNSQDQIASILSTYDDLIENNEKRIKTLEEMAQLFYTEWFVKFKFPGHEKIKMVDSGTEFGMIPEEWKVKKLENVADILFGYNFKSKLFNEEKNGARVVRIRDVLSGDTNTFTSEEVSQDYLIEKGDLLIGMDGIFHMKMWFMGGCYLNQRVARIRSEKLTASFIVESIKKQLYFFQKTIVGATVGHLSNGNIRDFKILVPTDNLLKVFKEITDIIINLKLQNQNLSKTRDLLIPQLVTGKREVKND